jgi:hypothetical protein
MDNIDDNYVDYEKSLQYLMYIFVKLRDYTEK